MFSIAVDNDWLQKNPALKNSVPPLVVEQTEKRILTSIEENRLLSACTNECAYLKPIIICALHSAMRKEEILKLEWKNVDLDKRIITILIQKNRKKSYIPMSKTLTDELLKLYKERTSKFVFVNPITNLPYVNIRNNYNKVLKQAGISNFTFHTLRHTACTRLLEQGVPVDVVKEIMRHSNVQITLDVYNHINQNRKFDAINALENYGK
jgi:integrase